jgi:phosphatidylglycerol lysyltransferase
MKKIAPFISVIFFGLALFFLDHELGQYTLGSMLDYISQISTVQIVLSTVLCAVSYGVLTLYDTLAVESIGKRLSYSKTAKAGFVGYGFSHNLGMPFLTGGSIRYRLYSVWGLSGLEVSKIVGFNALTFWMGFCTTGGLTLLLYSAFFPQTLLPVSSTIVGIVLLAVIGGYCTASILVKREVSIGRWSFSFPGFEMTCKQLLVSCLDWIIASSVLYALLPHIGIPFLGFFEVFLAAQIAGLFSQVPGGLGVFESVIMLYLSNFMEPSSVLGILLVYRLIYNLLPLVLATIVLGYQEYHVNKHMVKKIKSRTIEKLPQPAPKILGFFIFISGILTFFSKGFTWTYPVFVWLERIFSFPVMEMSRFFSTLSGAFKMVLVHSFVIVQSIIGIYF